MPQDQGGINRKTQLAGHEQPGIKHPETLSCGPGFVGVFSIPVRHQCLRISVLVTKTEAVSTIGYNGDGCVYVSVCLYRFLALADLICKKLQWA